MCQISKIIQHDYSTVANLQQYGQMLQKIYYFIFPFLSHLSSFFLFSSLSLSGSLSLQPVQDVHCQRRRRSSEDDSALHHTRSCSSHSISLQPLNLTHAPATRSHSRLATLDPADLTPRPPSISRSVTVQPFYLSLVVGFFFFFHYNLG